MADFGRLATWDCAGIVGGATQVHARLLVRRVPQAGADQRRRQISAKHTQREVSAAELALADWTLLITHVPRTMLTLTEALVVMRVRGQIERLFKV